MFLFIFFVLGGYMIGCFGNIFLKRLFLLALIFSFVFVSIAQNLNIRKQRADKFYETGEYARAATIYKKALKRNKNKSEKAEINFKITECFRLINNLKKIEAFYKKAIALHYSNPIIFYNYGTVLLKLEKYEEALVQFKKYKDLAPSEIKADEAIETVSLAKEWKKNPTVHVVKIFKKINSRYNDFCPSFDESKDYNDIYFTSDRGMNLSKQKRKRNSITGPSKSNITGQIFCDIFVIKKKKNDEWGDAVALDTTVNTIYDDGATSLTKDGKIMYFSTCKIEKGKQQGCQIFEMKKTAGNWAVPKQLKIIKDSTVSLGHVSVSSDGNILYFVSNMTGSKGGMDIWKVEKIKNGDWGTSENMKEINTAANEDFPFIREDGVFFFSSDRFPSMGGYDIFRAEKNEDGQLVIENMKSPVNSSGDDFGIVFKGKTENGLFTSNRIGGAGGDDIYSVEVPPVEFFVKGLVKNESGNFLPGAIIRLFGSDGSSFRDTTGKDGRFQRKLKKKTDYVFAVYKEGYFMGKAKFSTIGLTQSTDFKPVIILTALAKTFEISNINYDFGKTTLKEESKPTLDSLAEILKDNPNLTIELSSHSDMVGSAEINMDISQKRAQSVVDYLGDHGILLERMVAVGYGKSKPKVVTKDLAKQYSFFKENDVLDDAFVNSLKDDEKVIANALNRRTEFKVLSTNFIPGKKN